MKKMCVLVFFALVYAIPVIAADKNSEDEAKIKALIEKQSHTFYNRDWNAYQQTWAHEPYVVRMFNQDRTVGWAAVQNIYKNWWESYSEPVRNLKIDYNDYHIKINGNMALALHHQKTSGIWDDEQQTAYGSNVRFLEKIDGEWKTIYLNTAPRLPKPAMSGSELLNKVIAYHDPEGKWGQFQAQVHLVTTRRKGNYSEEIIEVNDMEDFYQSSRIDGDIRATRGVKKGEPFWSIDPGTSEQHEQIKKGWLGADNARRIREHHLCHIGLAMQLKSAGVATLDEVETAEFQGNDLYLLTMAGDSSKVKHPYYAAATYRIYVHPQTYKIAGFHFKNNRWDAYSVAVGEIELNGVKMPQAKIYYRSEDNSHIATDNFTLVK
jgi:ketosteroid isomerase-like protein